MPFSIHMSKPNCSWRARLSASSAWPAVFLAASSGRSSTTPVMARMVTARFVTAHEPHAIAHRVHRETEDVETDGDVRHGARREGRYLCGAHICAPR